MNGIIGMTNLMLGTPLSAQQRSYGEIVKESADALLNLINDILDLTKLESGRIDLDDSAFDISQTVEGAIGLMAERAQSKGVELTCYIAPDVPDIMTADAGRLRQILLNLLANAIKFTEEGSVELTVTLAPHSRSVLRIEVADSGIGIDASTLPRLFRPFSQAGGISRRYGGTGLGLAISRRLTEAMGGEINVESRVGEGSRFIVDLPVRASRQFRRIDPLDGCTVIIATAQPALADVAERYVRDWGGTALRLREPAEITRLAESAEGPVVVLQDWRLTNSPPDLFGALADASRHVDRRLLAVPVGAMRSVQDETNERFDRQLLLPLRRMVFYRALAGIEADPTMPDQAPSAAGKTGGRLRVLVVDDVPVNQKLAVSIVEIAGHEAVAVGSGREALQALRALPYDLVLMDVEMPEMDGLAATRAIRLMPGSAARIPIVAMTAHPGDAFVQRCLDAGMNAYLGKPLEAEKLVRALEQLAMAPAEAPVAASAAVLGPLTERIGADTARDLANSLREELVGWIGDMRDAIERGDEDGWRARAHSIRGAALNMGCAALAEAAAGFSPENRDPDVPLDVLFDRLKAESDAVRRQLTAELDDQGDA
ncbi:MAG: ATP-binding protein [Minwuia sp.]|uniref:ATP-binding protein n=1 Tax=Minwuia sp. TaxID=2493630 RepID=UPI003A876E94